MIQSNWVRSPGRKPQIHSHTRVMCFMPCQRASLTGWLGTGRRGGGLRRGCSTSQMRFCFSHPERPAREAGDRPVYDVPLLANPPGSSDLHFSSCWGPGAEKDQIRRSTLDHTRQRRKQTPHRRAAAQNNSGTEKTLWCGSGRKFIIIST